jgi:hypothetical protein
MTSSILLQSVILSNINAYSVALILLAGVTVVCLGEMIMSTPKRIKLFGTLEDGTIAKTHQAKEVVMFVSRDRKYKVSYAVSHNKNILDFVTPIGTYMLGKHYMHNYYWGDCKGVKVHVTLKKITGELRYWG